MTQPPQYQGPSIDPSVPWDIRVHLTQIYQKLGNHYQGISLLNSNIAKLKSTATTITENISGGGGGGGGVASNIGIVNNQTGNTSYTTQGGDNGALIILSDASPIALTLAATGIPYFLFIANLGAGLTTLTPATPPSGTSTISYASNPAAASMPFPGGTFCIAAFDGNNWFAAIDILPQSITKVTHEWLDSYDAATGLFTRSQPAYADISGTPQLPNTIAPVAGEYLTGYDATTGNFSASSTPGISVTITTAALTTLGTQGSMTFTNGILTAQTPAT